MKKLMFIVVLLIASVSLFSQEYEIAWEKDIGGSFAQFSKDGEYIYVAQGLEIWKYRSSDGEYISKFDTLGANFKSDKIYNGIIISGNGNFIVARIDAGDCVMFDTKTEKVFKSLNFGGSSDISPDENYIYTARYDGTYLTKFDIMQNKQIIQRKIINEVFSKAKLSHNGKMFATASIYTDVNKKRTFYLTLWDTETLTEIKRFQLENFAQGAEFQEIKFSYDDKFVGVNALDTYESRIFNTQSLDLVINSNSFYTMHLSDFAFLDNDIIFYFSDIEKSIYKIACIDNKTLKEIQSFNKFSRFITTSSNNLLFNSNTLISPITIGVTDEVISEKQINISTIKNTLIVENNSIPIYTPSIKLFDLKGNTLFSIIQKINTGANRITLPRTIINGTYIIQIESKGLNFSQKILIEG